MAKPISPALRALLLRIENAPYHALPTHRANGRPNVTRRDVARLIALGLVRELPANGRFCARYVTTSKAAHGPDLGTFAAWADSLKAEWRATVRYRFAAAEEAARARADVAEVA